MGTVGNIANQLNSLSPCESSNCCQQIDALKGQIDGLGQQITFLSAELRSTRSRIADIDGKQQSLEQWVRDQIGQLAASIDRKIDAILAQVLQSIADLRNFVLSLLSGRDGNLEPRVASLEERMNTRGLREQDLFAQLNALAARVSGLEAWKASVESVLSGLSEWKNAIESRLAALEGWKSAIESRLSDLESQIQNWGERLKSLESQIQELKNSIDGIKRYIDEQIGKLKSYLERLIRDSIDRLKYEIDAQLQMVEGRVTKNEESIGEVKNKLEQYYDFLRSELSKLTSFIYAQLRALTDLIYSLLGGRGSESDNDFLSRRIDIAERSIDSINRRISNLPAQIQESQNKISSLESSVSELFRRLRNVANEDLSMNEIRQLFSTTWDLIAQSSRTNNNSAYVPKLDAILNLISDNIQRTSRVLSKVDLPITGETLLSDCGDGEDNIAYAYSGTGLNAISDQITSLTNALSVKLCNLETSTSPEDTEERDKTLNNIYRILGGDKWIDSANQVRIYHDPEKDIKTAAEKHFNSSGISSKNMEAGSLIEWIQNVTAVNYYRAGYQELPGEVPETLLSIGSDKDRKIKNSLDLNQWLIEQLDALIGQFPLEIEIKDADPLTPGDQTKKLELGNMAEVLAELVGLNFMQSQNTDILLNYINRLGVETIATKNAAIIAQDYAKANASYLGYNANPVKRTIPYALNPAGDSLETILADTKGELIGWENTDKSSVSDYLKRIFFTVGIIKESNFIRPNNVGRLIDSLNMVRAQENEEASAKLTNDIATINDPNSTFNSARRNDSSLPESQVKIKKKI